MYELRGFMAMPSLADNASNGVVARFGELSSHVRTFTRDEKNFANPTYPNVELVSLKLVDDDGVSITPSSSFINKLLALGNWVFTQFNANAIPANSAKSSFITAIQNEHSGILDVKIGELMNGLSPNSHMPDYISCTLLDGVGKNYSIKIWFSDARLRLQYEDFTIFVIPPIASIDDLNTNITSLGNLLQSTTPADIIARANSVVGDKKYTILTTQGLTWYDPNNANSYKRTDWYVVVHGQAGLDQDNIKNEIRNYISGHSTLTNWNKIYPELYSENEFVVVPLWDNLAIPDTNATIGLYSGILDYGKMKSTAQARLPVGYSQLTNISSFLDTNLRIVNVMFRGMACLVVGNPTNSGSFYDFRKKYIDYQSMGTDSIDFIRMGKDTRDFVLKLNAALEYARTMLSTDVAPEGYAKITRGNRVYLTFNIHGYFYLVLIKESY